MVKTRSKFVCQQCGSQYPTAYGRCPNCSAWGSLVETVETIGPPSAAGKRETSRGRYGVAAPRPLAHVDSRSWARVAVPTAEFGRVLGGGIVPGSLVLVGGDPGIGKSTLLLQLCIEMAAQRPAAAHETFSRSRRSETSMTLHDVANAAADVAGAARPVLYVSGEESAEQVKLRADRLGVVPPDLFILAETNLEAIVAAIEDLTPQLVIVDSIQTMALEELSSAAGSISQVRECTARLMRLAKTTHVPIFIVGHVTKEGTIAGPRVLEHIVDTVLYLEGERFHAYRLLRSVKNRYGSTDEIGVFEMRDTGLVAVENPSAAFLAERGTASPGSAIVVTLEGSRPLLVELQALVSQTGFSLPRRTSTGVDLNRLYILLAVLAKRIGLPMGNQDVYCNVVGGLKIGEPAADLAIVLAVVSSFIDVALPADLAAFGEVGLAGEVRSVSQVTVRLNEAAKLGFTRCLLPGANLRGLKAPPGMTLTGVNTLHEALRAVIPAAAFQRGRAATAPPSWSDNGRPGRSSAAARGRQDWSASREKTSPRDDNDATESNVDVPDAVEADVSEDAWESPL